MTSTEQKWRESEAEMESRTEAMEGVSAPWEGITCATKRRGWRELCMHTVW